MPDRHEPTHLPQSHLMEEVSNTHAKGAAPQAIIAHESEQARYRRPAALHAEKNQDIEVENDETHRGSAHRTETVDANENLTVGHHAPRAGTEPVHLQMQLTNTMISGYMETHGPGSHSKFDGIAGEPNITARPGTHAKYDGIDGERDADRHATPPNRPLSVWEHGNIPGARGIPEHQADTVGHYATTAGSDPDDGPSTLIGSHESIDTAGAHHGGLPFDAIDATGHGHAHPGHTQDGDAHLLHLDHAVTDSHLDSGVDAAVHALGDGAHHGHSL